MKKAIYTIQQKASPLVLASSLFLMLSACGGTGQDSGVATPSNQSIQGLIIDGYVARGIVYLDSNNDGARNPWEAWSFTDNDGYFSFNPLTNTNYCLTTATAEQAQYCLNVNSNSSNAIIRVDGGYDVLTGEPFVGQMSRRISEDTSDQLLIISPITSVLSEVSSENQETLLSHLGLQENDLDVDYLNVDGSNTVDNNLLNTALKIHKTVSILSDRLTDTYDEIGETFGTPNDATSAIYPNLAQQILSAQTSLDNVLSNPEDLTAIIDSSEETLRDVYQRRDITLPPDLGDATNLGGLERIVEITSNIPDLVNVLIPSNNLGASSDEVIGSIRTLESVVIKTLNESNNDSTIDNAIDFFSNPENTALIDSLTQSLAMDGSSVVGLSSNDFTGTDFDSVEDIEENFQPDPSITAFSNPEGMTLKISDLDLGVAPNNLNDTEIEFYFDDNGNSDSLSGTFTACIKHITNVQANQNLGSTDVEGELIMGFWSLLSPNENRQSFSYLLTVTFLGSTYQTILRAGGEATINGIDYSVIRSDATESLTDWYSQNGFSMTNTIPTNNEECKERLPSRIGF